MQKKPTFEEMMKSKQGTKTPPKASKTAIDKSNVAIAESNSTPISKKISETENKPREEPDEIERLKEELKTLKQGNKEGNKLLEARRKEIDELKATQQNAKMVDFDYLLEMDQLHIFAKTLNPIEHPALQGIIKRVIKNQRPAYLWQSISLFLLYLQSKKKVKA